MKRLSPVTLISLGLTLLTVLAGGMTGNRSEDFETSKDYLTKPVETSEAVIWQVGR